MTHEEKKGALINTNEKGIDDDSEDEEDLKEHHVFPISANTILFQGIMILSAMYYAMLCTNWMNPAMCSVDRELNPSESTYWLKIVWFCEDKKLNACCATAVKREINPFGFDGASEGMR